MNLEMMEDHSHQAVWDGYLNNLPRYLIGLSRYLQSSTMHTLCDELGYRDLKINYEPFFALVGRDGCRLTELADWLAISKQSCNRTANQIKKVGYLEDKPDPSDGRAKILVMTKKGISMVTEASNVSLELENSFKIKLGSKNYSKLLEIIRQIYNSLNMPKFRVDMSRTEAQTGLLVSLLPRVSDYFMQALMEETKQRGHVGLKMSHGQVLSLIGLSGGRIQQIAKIQDVSKQAISAIAKELKNLGYIQQSRDSCDGRGVVLMFTDKGLGLISDSVVSVKIVEKQLSDILGQRDLLVLKKISKDLYQSLHLEEEVFSPRLSNLSLVADESLNALAITLRHELGEKVVRALGQLLITTQSGKTFK
tara:strand:+ start:1050 stop:2141 length:1092 start_codon:yes stop_codon:yes gene_type:complete